MNYTIRKIRKEDDAVIENIIRSCLIEFGAAREGTAWACLLYTSDAADD